MGYHVLGYMDFGDWVIRSALPFRFQKILSFLFTVIFVTTYTSVVDPDPYVFGPSGSVSHRYGPVRIRILPSSSKKKYEKIWIPTVL
jgi:hypothetical protein